jgi:hypothetical protein
MGLTLVDLTAFLIFGAIPVLAIGGHLWHVWQVRRGMRAPDQAEPPGVRNTTIAA